MTFLRKLRRNISRHSKTFGSDTSGIAFLEFALMLPVFLGFILSATEMANYVLARQKVQKVSFMTSDIIAQATVKPNEQQIQDSFFSMNSASQPFPLRQNGRVILTGIVGIIDNTSGDVENKLVWQRCYGSRTGFNSSYGTETTEDFGDRASVTLPQGIVLPQGQMIIAAEVAYDYQPIVNVNYFNLIGAEKELVGTTTLRTRNKAFTSLTQVPGFTPMTC
ncbi:MAG: TadE/TadG family type IV pilus assembly protein [Pacificimonas sp.]